MENEKATVEALGMKSVSIPLSALKTVKDANINRFLKIVTDPEQQPVLIHCRQDQDRAGTMVGIYRLTQQNWTASNAYKEMLKFGFHPFSLALSGSMNRVANAMGKLEAQPTASVLSSVGSR